MTGLYDIMTRSGFTNHIMLTTDVKGGDMLVVSTGNYNRFVTEYRFLQSPTAGYGFQFWRDGYALIANANQAIDKLPSAPITDAQKKEYLAEARTIRAWANHELIRLFAQPYSVDPNSPGLPKVDRPLTPSETTPARSTVKDIYDFILADLLYAKDNLPASRTSAYRVTLNSVNGLMARVYLDMGSWQKASDAAKLARNGFPLAAASTLLNGFVDPTSEWIWGMNYRSDDNTGYLQLASFQEPYDIGYSTFRATSDFYALFTSDDIRQKQFFVNMDIINGTGASSDPLKRDRSAVSRDGLLMNKFLFRSSWDLNVPLMRSAEMFLVEAEAEAELGNTLNAQTALFQVQKRAIASAAMSANTGNTLKDEIQNERRKELYGEGFRLFDIQRRKQTLVRTAPAHWSPLTLASGDYKNALPIPQQEREASNMAQNAGYPN